MKSKTGIVSDEINFIKDLIIQFSGVESFTDRSRELPKPYLRFVFMALCRKFTKRSFAEIGLACGDRDHGTVINGVNKFNQHYRFDFFNPYRSLFLEISKVLEEKEYHTIAKIKEMSIAEHEIESRNRFINFVSKQRPIINRLKRKLDVFRHREVFHQIALLSDDDLEEFETRAKAFLAMKRIKYKSDV